MAERSKALDWNSSNILTGVRGFESHSLRQIFPGLYAPEMAVDRDDPAAKLPYRPWWLAPVSPRRPAANPVRPGREQRYRRCRVPEVKLVRAASLAHWKKVARRALFSDRGLAPAAKSVAFPI
jgi:hypothetical protein